MISFFLLYLYFIAIKPRKLIHNKKKTKLHIIVVAEQIPPKYHKTFELWSTEKRSIGFAFMV